MMIGFMRMPMSGSGSMTMAMAIAMSGVGMSVVKRHDAHQIDAEAKNANNQQFPDPLHLSTIHQPLNGLGDNLDADQPGRTLIEGKRSN